MSDQGLPAEVKDLLLDHIGSVAHLEALLFFRAHPAEIWDSTALAKRLYAPEKDMMAALVELSNAGFLRVHDGSYCYAPRPEDCARVDALAEAYAHQLIAITNLIHGRGRNIRAFSDAFKLRKER